MSALTPEDSAGNCVVFERVIAGMIYGGGNEAMRGQRRSRATPSCKQSRQCRGRAESAGIFRAGRWVASGRLCPALAKGVSANRSTGLLDRRRVGGIPDVGDEGVRFCVAPFVRLGRSELAIHYADFVDDGPSRGGQGRRDGNKVDEAKQRAMRNALVRFMWFPGNGISETL